MQFSVADAMNSLYRETMEDTYRIEPEFIENGSFFSIYDGHGGREVAEYLHQYYHLNLKNELKFAGNDKDMEKIFRASYLYTDVKCCQTLNVPACGATAVTCLMVEEKGRIMLYTANVGDSRAVLCRNGKAERLSVDHKAESPMEMKRIVANGGFVKKERAIGILAVARSFGDAAFKRHIIADPSVSAVCLNEHKEDSVPFIILACDGVWDVISDQEAVDAISKVEDKRKAGQVLVDMALERDTDDNVTVVVVYCT